jgi:hypothetical protein
MNFYDLLLYSQYHYRLLYVDVSLIAKEALCCKGTEIFDWYSLG